MSATPDSTLANPEQLTADLQRQLAEAKTERDEALAERDKAQRRLAERTAERDEALEQQTATAEVLQVINSSPGDLAPVFDAMCDKAMRLCGADLGFFLRYTDGKYEFAAGRGLRPGFAQYLSRMDQPGPHEANTRVVEGVAYVHMLDIKDSAAYRVPAGTNCLSITSATRCQQVG